MFSNGILNMNILVLANQQKLRLTRSVQTPDAVKRTYREWWPLSMDGMRVSRKYLLSAFLMMIMILTKVRYFINLNLWFSHSIFLFVIMDLHLIYFCCNYFTEWKRRNKQKIIMKYCSLNLYIYYYPCISWNCHKYI